MAGTDSDEPKGAEMINIAFHQNFYQEYFLLNDVRFSWNSFKTSLKCCVFRIPVIQVFCFVVFCLFFNYCRVPLPS
jgi:hypothetical protein